MCMRMREWRPAEPAHDRRRYKTRYIHPSVSLTAGSSLYTRASRGAGRSRGRTVGAAGGNRDISAKSAVALVERCRNGIAMVRNVGKHLIRFAALSTFSSRRRLGRVTGHTTRDRSRWRQSRHFRRIRPAGEGYARESNARAQRQKSSSRSRYCGGTGYCIRRK